MQKVIEPTQAIIDFERLETSFQRAIQPNMQSETRVFWINYYDRRSKEIAAIHNTTVEDLIHDWMRWKNQPK